MQAKKPLAGVPRRGAQQNKKPSTPHKKKETRVGTIEGTLVHDILLNTGYYQTLKRKELVPVERMIVREVPIRCAHGDVHMYPLAQLEMNTGGSTFAVEAGVTDHLPVSVL